MTLHTSLIYFIFKLSRDKYLQYEKNLSIVKIFNYILFYEY